MLVLVTMGEHWGDPFKSRIFAPGGGDICSATIRTIRLFYILSILYAGRSIVSIFRQS